MEEFNNYREYHWTEQAIYCYKRGCICDGCFIKETIETPCRMKRSVLEIVRLHGKPPEEKPMPTREEILEYSEQGYLMRDVAKMYGVDKTTFYKYTQSLGLNCKRLKRKNNAKWRR